MASGSHSATLDAIPEHVYEPDASTLPALGAYLRTFVQRRRFAWVLARSELKAAHFGTVLGQLWMLLSPLLLALVYFVLVVILRGSRTTEQFMSLVACLFLYQFTQNSVVFGAGSVVQGGRLILNMSFPRLLLPTADVIRACIQLVPMLLLYSVMHIVAGQPLGAAILALPLLLAIHTVLNLGAAFFSATSNVYFRDVRSMLQYVLRVWLYLTPVIYTVNEVPMEIRTWMQFNPLYPLFASYQSILFENTVDWGSVAAAGLWAALLFLVGTTFFLSKERYFALRV